MTTMTSEQAWEFIQTCKPATWQELRQAAVRRIHEMSTDSDHGISSSDVNHTAVGILVSAGYDSPITKRIVELDWNSR